MTEIWKRVYKANIINALQELADKNYQNDVWLNRHNPNHWVGSFVEAACGLFDDCVITHYLSEGEVILDEKVTAALKELGAAVDAVDEFRDEEKIINDPLMDIVREKAARALFLVNISTYEGTTVDVAVPGQDKPLPRNLWQ
ncbi:MAG: hypothetical protein V4735_05320 [Pseudomonadota bacterium]